MPTLSERLHPLAVRSPGTDLVHLTGNPSRFSDLCSPSRFAALLMRLAGATAVDGPRVVPFRAGRWRPDLVRAIARRGWDGLRRLRGLTVRVTHLHHDDPRFAAFVRSARRSLGRGAGLNAYFSTPASGTALPFHADAGDVFVFQIDGRKTWEFRRGRKKRTCRLEPGDALFVPVGLEHRARTDGTRHSLHLTLQTR